MAGREITIFTLGKVDPPRLASARVVARTLERLGFRTRLKTFENFNRYYSTIGRAATGAQIGNEGWFAAYPIASNFFPVLLRCDAYTPRARHNYNASGFCDARLDDLMDRATAAQTRVPGEAAGLWERVDRAVVDAAAWLPLVNERGIDLVSSGVGNYQRHPSSACSWLSCGSTRSAAGAWLPDPKSGASAVLRWRRSRPRA